MTPSIEHELRAHASALRALARDLVGAGDAEDIVQDAAVQALSSPPRRPGPLGAWLAAIVRHLASKHRRAQRRRVEREQRAAQPEALPPADHQVEAEDSLRRLTDLVLALPAPYRGALVLRYVKDLTPTQIAAETATSVATIKSQLQRGLALLRQELDRDGRTADWRKALGMAFALEPPRALAAAGTASTIIGAALMGTGMKLAGGGAVALLALSAFLFLDGDAAPRPGQVAPEPRSDATAMAAGTEASEGSARPAQAAPQRAAASAGVVADGTLATIRARLVDEHGSVVSGVRATLKGTPSDERSPGDPPVVPVHEAFTVEHISASDGRLELRFDAWPMFLITVDLEHPRLVPMQATWRTLKPGEVVDLGDVVLRPGVLLRGRVVDTGSAPVAGTVRFRRQGGGRVLGALEVRDLPDTRTEANGSFTVSGLPPAIEYEASIREGRRIERGQRFRVPVDAAAFDAEIVVARPEDVEAIAGCVLDEKGRPLAGARVGANTAFVLTKDDGRFRLRRVESDSGEPIRLTVKKEGYEWLRVEPGVAWGSHDVRLTLREGPGLDVCVVAAAKGAPVEEFALSVYQGSSVVHRLELQHHERGVVRIPRQRGQYLIRVEARDETLSTSAFTPVEVTGPGPARVEVRLHARGSRLVRLLGTAGAPVTGCRMQLVECVYGGIDPPPLVRPIERWGGVEGNPKALLLQEAVTDAQGEARLQGPSGPALGLLILGPGCMPTRLASVTLAPSEPLLVTVGAGARLEGRLLPAGIVGVLRQHAGLPATGRVEDARRLPGLRLLRTEGGELYPRWGAPAFAVAEDGTFSMGDLPAGRWHLVVMWSRRTGSGWSDDSETVATVELRADEARRIDVDLSALQPAVLDGVVLWNDKPLAGEPIAVFVDRGVDARGRSQKAGYDLTTDKAGRFQVRDRAGRFRVQWRQLGAVEETQVAAGGRAAQTFNIRTGSLRLRLVDGEGKPVGGVRVVLFDDAGRHRHALAATSADGWTGAEVEAQAFSAQALPKRLQAESKPTGMEGLPGWPDPHAGRYLRLGEVAAKQGVKAEAELRLPPEWHR